MARTDANPLQQQLNRLISPETRRRLFETTYTFCVSKPWISSFIVINLLFALAPLLGFLVFTIFLASLFVFWVGVGLTVLGVVFLVTATLATLTWAWFAAAVFAARWALTTFFPRAAPRAQSRSNVLAEGETADAKPKKEPKEPKTSSTSAIPGPEKTGDMASEFEADEHEAINVENGVNGTGKTNGTNGAGINGSNGAGEFAPKPAGTYNGVNGGGGAYGGLDGEAEKLRMDIAKSLK